MEELAALSLPLGGGDSPYYSTILIGPGILLLPDSLRRPLPPALSAGFLGPAVDPDIPSGEKILTGQEGRARRRRLPVTALTGETVTYRRRCRISAGPTYRRYGQGMMDMNHPR